MKAAYPGWAVLLEVCRLRSFNIPYETMRFHLLDVSFREDGFSNRAMHPFTQHGPHKFC